MGVVPPTRSLAETKKDSFRYPGSASGPSRRTRKVGPYRTDPLGGAPRVGFGGYHGVLGANRRVYRWPAICSSPAWSSPTPSPGPTASPSSSTSWGHPLRGMVAAATVSRFHSAPSPARSAACSRTARRGGPPHGELQPARPRGSGWCSAWRRRSGTARAWRGGAVAGGGWERPSSQSPPRQGWTAWPRPAVTRLRSSRLRRGGKGVRGRDSRGTRALRGQTPEARHRQPPPGRPPRAVPSGRLSRTSSAVPAEGPFACPRIRAPRGRRNRGAARVTPVAGGWSASARGGDL
jgi:hypothetical protein